MSETLDNEFATIVNKEFINEDNVKRCKIASNDNLGLTLIKLDNENDFFYLDAIVPNKSFNPDDRYPNYVVLSPIVTGIKFMHNKPKELDSSIFNDKEQLKKMFLDTMFLRAKNKFSPNKKDRLVYGFCDFAIFLKSIPKQFWKECPEFVNEIISRYNAEVHELSKNYLNDNEERKKLFISELSKNVAILKEKLDMLTAPEIKSFDQQVDRILNRK